ncbi:MAG TPA: hypothetical protein VHM01_11210 [Alphaproteobacteria bacterium]|nr:hypothetical protein [Alphaproteobacteria bacterium]
MKLSSTQTQRAAAQIGAQVIPDDHPVAHELKGIFGDHTFFLDGNGLEVVEAGEPTDGSSLANVVNLASWADEARTALVPHAPQVTDVVVEVGPENPDSAA